MDHSFKVGVSFGLTSSVITTLGLMVGLNSGTHSKLVVIGGILMIAIADAISDALGIHVSEESENKHTTKEIYISTFSTFITKFLFTLTFLVPILLFTLSTAVMISIIWGLTALILLTFYIQKSQNKSPWKAILEHLSIAVLVIIITNYVGKLVSNVFG